MRTADDPPKNERGFVGMPLIAGLDRSDTPDARRQGTRRQLYTVCMAAVEDGMEAWQETFGGLRDEVAMQAGDEFHGSSCPEWIQVKVLRAALERGLRVGVAMYEKEPLTEAQYSAKMPPGIFQSRAGLDLLGAFFALHSVRMLHCDEDIHGDARKAFESEARSLHRQRWPDERIKVLHRASKNADLIQLADVMGYGASRLERGLVEDAELRAVLKAILTAPGNVVLGPMPFP